MITTERELKIGQKVKMHALGDGANDKYNGSTGTIVKMDSNMVTIIVSYCPIEVRTQEAFYVSNTAWGCEIITNDWDD